MLMEMFTRVIGLTIKLMVKESTTTRMGQNTRVSGTKISSMDRDWKHGQMEPGMKDSMPMGRRMAMESFNGQMVQHTKAHLWRTTYTGKVSTHGQTNASTTVNG